MIVGVHFISVASTVATTCLILILFSLNSFLPSRGGGLEQDALVSFAAMLWCGSRCICY